MSAQRYPLQPLADALGVSFETPDADGVCRGQSALGTLLGVSRDSVRNWRKRGIPGHVDVDRLCLSLGLWAANVWPEQWLEGLDDEGELGYFADDPSIDDLGPVVLNEQPSSTRRTRRTAA